MENIHDQQMHSPPTPPPHTWCPPPPTSKRVYTAAQRTLARLCWLLGYLVWRWVMVVHSGAGVLAFAVVFTGVLLWFGRQNGVRWRWAALLPAVFALPFLLNSPGVLLVLDMPVFLFLCIMSIYLTFDRPRYNLSDPLRALLLRPFGHLGAGLMAFFSRPADAKPRGRWRAVVGGLFLALPLTLIVGALLISADAAFSNLAEKLLRPLDWWDLQWFWFVPRLVIAIPVALYIFAAFYGNTNPKASDLSDERWQAARGRIQRMSTTVLLTAGIPLCGLYLLFFVSQTAYYFSAFSGLLPADFTYAEYARQGFFQLCAVAVINLGVLVTIRAFSRREGEGLPRSLKIYSTVLCGFTLLLIATALRKMLLYIEQYGLTPLRVYTSWFMVLLAAVFLVLAVTQFLPRVRSWRILATVCLVMFAVLQFSNVNGWIARYNVEQYKAGQLQSVDVSLFYNLGDAAVPHAVELLEDENLGVADQARRYLNHCRAKWEGDDSWITFNLTTHHARELVEKLDK